MIAVGFDVGTHRIAMSVPALGMCEEIDLTRAFKGLRDGELRQLQRWVRDELYDYAEPCAFIERPFVSNGFARNQTSSLGMAETVGVIRAAVRWHQPAVMVVPGTWKKELVGDGRATKAEARKWLLEYEGEDFKEQLSLMSEDMCDAYCVGTYGHLVLQGAIQLPVKQPRRKRVAKKEG